MKIKLIEDDVCVRFELPQTKKYAHIFFWRNHDIRATDRMPEGCEPDLPYDLLGDKGDAQFSISSRGRFGLMKAWSIERAYIRRKGEEEKLFEERERFHYETSETWLKRVLRPEILL